MLSATLLTIYIRINSEWRSQSENASRFKLKYHITSLDWTNSCQTTLDKPAFWFRTAYPCCFFDNVVPRLVWKWHVLLNQSLHDNWILQGIQHIISNLLFLKHLWVPITYKTHEAVLKKNSLTVCALIMYPTAS